MDIPSIWLRLMKLAVCIKQTPDTEARIRIAPHGRGIEEDLTWIISPHDESAVEQALQIREEHGGSVTVVALGPSRVVGAIRQALAMGADAGLHLYCDEMPMDGGVVAAALLAALQPRGFDLILAGEQSIDQAGSQVPQRLAAALGWPCVTAVEELSIDAGGNVRARCPREQAEEICRFTLPGVIGINRRIGEPRYPSFRGIMKAKRKEVELVHMRLEAAQVALERLHAPPRKAAGQIRAFGSGIEHTVAQFLGGMSDS